MGERKEVREEREGWKGGDTVWSKRRENGWVVG